VTFRRLIAAIGLAAALSGCGSSPTAPTFGLRGGVLATFAVGTEQFRVFVTNAAAVQALLALDRDGGAGFPNGRIRTGAGAGNHNAPYTWSLDPEEIEIVPLAIELCDGRPSYVEAHRQEYVDVVGRYCPWGARLVELVDLR
jgi:hypothetical protein